MILTHSPDTALVVVNLPDPPDLMLDKTEVTEQQQMNPSFYSHLPLQL